MTEDVILGNVLLCLELQAAGFQKVPLQGFYSIPARFLWMFCLRVTPLASSYTTIPPPTGIPFFSIMNRPNSGM